MTSMNRRQFLVSGLTATGALLLGAPLGGTRRGVREPLVGNQLGGEIFVDGKIEAVAKFKILRPFLIGHEIGATRFDFDDGEGAAPVERNHVCPPPVLKAKLGQADLAERAEMARKATRQSGGDLVEFRCSRVIGHRATVSEQNRNIKRLVQAFRKPLHVAFGVRQELMQRRI